MGAHFKKAGELRDMYYIESMKIIMLQLNSKNSQEEFIQQNFPDIFVL